MNQFDWDDIRIFLKVYQTQSMSSAAAELDMSQSTISRRLSALEKRFGARLFERTTNGLLPTQAAQDIVSDAKIMENSAVACLSKVHNRDKSVSGTVRLAIAGQFAQTLIVQSFKELLKRYPLLSLEYVDHMSAPDMNNREADISLRMLQLKNPELIVRQVAKLSYGIYAHKDVVIDESQPLESQPWITWVPELSYVPDCVWLQKHHPNHRAVVRATNRGILLAATLAGIGISIFPNVFARTYPELKQIYVGQYQLPVQPLWLACHRDSRQLPRINVVWQHLQQVTARFADTPATTETEPKTTDTPQTPPNNNADCEPTRTTVIGQAVRSRA